jgi:VWFA-related protein
VRRFNFAFNFSIAEAQISAPSNRPRQAATPSPTSNGRKRFRQLRTTPEVEEIIMVDTELVNLNVRVIDRNNRPINNLAQKEFQILEDGVPQPIEFFSKSEVPTNYTLVIDNSGSLRMQLEKVIEASKILVNSNRPDDETSIIRFVSRDKISIEQDFTSDKTELSDSLENLYIEGGQTAIIARFI